MAECSLKGKKTLREENTVGKGEIARSFFRSVFKRLTLQTRKNQGLFGKRDKMSL